MVNKIITATLYRSHKKALFRFFRKFFIRCNDVSSSAKVSSLSGSFPRNFIGKDRIADKVEVMICLFISGSLNCVNFSMVSS